MLLEAQKELVDYKGLGISVLGKTLKNLHFSGCRCLTKLINKVFDLGISALFSNTLFW